MYISHKNNVIQSVYETEWQCRRMAKGISKPEYWTWLASITTQDENGHDVVTYPSEDFTIVECTDEDVQERLVQLDDYKGEGVYNIKWSDEKVDGSHFTGDDSAKDARLLAEEWTSIRGERDRLLTETDWMTFADSPALSDDWKTYRQTLRDLPNAQKAKTTYESITWPSKPS